MTITQITITRYHLFPNFPLMFTIYHNLVFHTYTPVTLSEKVIFRSGKH